MKILVADDHELFLDGIVLSLSSMEENPQIEKVCDYEQLIKIINEQKNFDLILTDLAMPGMVWSDALKTIRERLPNTPIIILSAVHDKEIVMNAVNMGVSGFIPKTSTSKVILSAINLVLSGGLYLPPEILKEQEEAKGIQNLTEMNKSGVSLQANDISTILTPRQTEVLKLIGEGKPNKIIARELNLSEGTVKLHVTAILKALGVTNRTGAVVAAAKYIKGE